MFEEEMAHYTGAPYAVSMNSCTNALFLACKWHNVSEKDKMDLLKKVVKGFNHQSIPNGRKGTKYDKVFNLDGLLSYCTKQNRNNIPNEYVIDLMNSDGLDNEWYRKNYGRHQTVLTWAH